jgi:type IV pilus assembly protein PilE
MRRNHAVRRRAAGFTLIELMIVVAIVAILIAIAVGSYDFATTKTRRNAAKGCLTEAAQYMERYYSMHGLTYDDLDNPAQLPTCSADVTDYYTIAFAADEPTASSYKVQATPKGSQASSDTRCGTLSIDDKGTKGANDVDACW